MNTYVRNARGWFKAYACNQDGSPQGEVVLNKRNEIVPMGEALEIVQADKWPLTEAERAEKRRKLDRERREISIVLTGGEIDSLIDAAYFARYEGMGGSTLDRVARKLELAVDGPRPLCRFPSPDFDSED